MVVRLWRSQGKTFAWWLAILVRVKDIASILDTPPRFSSCKVHIANCRENGAVLATGGMYADSMTLVKRVAQRLEVMHFGFDI
jgi:hypothetical protein